MHALSITEDFMRDELLHELVVIQCHVDECLPVQVETLASKLTSKQRCQAYTHVMQTC